MVPRVTLKISLPPKTARELEDEEFPQDNEPQEGDYVISAEGNIGQWTQVGVVGGKHLGTFKGSDQEDDASHAIRADMQRQKFWPQVWWHDDHGGYTKRTLEDMKTRRARRLPKAHPVRTPADWKKFLGKK